MDAREPIAFNVAVRHELMRDRIVGEGLTDQAAQAVPAPLVVARLLERVAGVAVVAVVAAVAVPLRATLRSNEMQSATRIAVLGASPKPDRYSNQAVRLLIEHGYDVIPIHPAHDTIEGLPVAARLEDIDDDVDTVTVYMRAAVSSKLTEALIALAPRRVIFNPGSENDEFLRLLKDEGIFAENACTLVMLQTGQFIL